MGMVIYLRRASPAEIAQLKDDAGSWEAFAFEAPADGDLIDFDKAWDALHFMLTGGRSGADSPLGIIAGDGETFGSDEHGFGGFTIISPGQMRSFASALNELSDADLAGRYDPPAMEDADVYLSDVFLDEGDEALDYVLQGVPALRRFAAICAANGDGALRIIA